MIEHIAPIAALRDQVPDDFRNFRKEIEGAIADGTLADGVIGKGLRYEGSHGEVTALYADYAASGRALKQIERFVYEEVLPVYANPHTQASHCGRSINRLRRAARETIARSCGADANYAVIFAGAGATAGIHRLVRLFGADCTDAEGRPALVVLGPYEHHSNLLPWRESGADVVELREGERGGPDLAELECCLLAAKGRRIICSFSAGSNVTGALTDVADVTRLAKRHGARVVWDYAGAAPYVPVRVAPAHDVQVDALVWSPHKYVGGPAASGLLVVRRDAVVIECPSAPGGGTVSFVSPQGHDFLGSLEAREEAGTPNAIGDIRAALATIVKDCLLHSDAYRCAQSWYERALAKWRANPRITVLEPAGIGALPIVSFRVRDGQGRNVHHQLVTRILSDRFGIQARGGCACAGPYVHRLLDIDDAESIRIRASIQAGDELDKPGFVRINFSPLMDVRDADMLIETVDLLAQNVEEYVEGYVADQSSAVFARACG